MGSHNKPVDLAYNYIEPPECLLDKAPIIFLHGITGSKESWRNVPDLICNATKRKAYVVDSRNHGDSPWTDEFNFEVNVIDLLNFMDKVNVSSAILIGHSMGGITAYKTALKAPERVEKVVVEDMYASKPLADKLNMIVMYITLSQMAIQQVPPAVSEEDARRIVIDFIFSTIPQAVMTKHKIVKPDYRDDCNAALKKTETGAYAFKCNTRVLINALKDHNNIMADVVGDYKGAISFIYGTISSMDVLSHKDDAIKHFPHAEFVGIEGANHLVHVEKPDDFLNAVLKFLLKE